MLKIKGGESNISSSAKMVLNDFQRGKLPYYVKPASITEEEEARENKKAAEEADKKDEMKEVGKLELEEVDVAVSVEEKEKVEGEGQKEEEVVVEEKSISKKKRNTLVGESSRIIKRRPIKKKGGENFNES